MPQSEEGNCHSARSVDVELAILCRKPWSLPNLHRVSGGKPPQGHRPHHNATGFPITLMHSGPDPVLSTGGTRHSNEGKRKQDGNGHGAHVRPSHGSGHATILSSQLASSAQTSARDHLTLGIRVRPGPCSRPVTLGKSPIFRPECSVNLLLNVLVVC